MQDPDAAWSEGSKEGSQVRVQAPATGPPSFLSATYGPSASDNAKPST